MGRSISWIAVKDCSAETLLEQFDLERNGDVCEPFNPPCSVKQLANGWTILALQGCEHKFLGAERVKPLSQGRELVSCWLEEHVMISAAEGWRDGRKLWRVVHDGEEELGDMEIDGDPPAAFVKILRCARERQARDDAEVQANANELGQARLRLMQVDYLFDVPAQLTRSRTGFAHDKRLPIAAGFQTAVARARTPKRRWLFW